MLHKSVILELNPGLNTLINILSFYNIFEEVTLSLLWLSS